MRHVDGVVGNRYDDPDLDEQLHAHEAAGRLERVVLEAGQRKRSRLRVETDAGTDLGIVVDQPELRAGDVLFLDDDAAAVVEFESRTAFVVDLPSPGPQTVAAAVELGHRVGNQHWDIAIEDGTVYVPVEADRRIIEDVLGEHVPDGATTRYASVDASLFIGENAEPSGVDHSHEATNGHGHGGDHSHSHGDSHDHGHGHDHSHE